MVCEILLLQSAFVKAQKKKKKTAEGFRVGCGFLFVYFFNIMPFLLLKGGTIFVKNKSYCLISETRQRRKEKENVTV